LRRSVAGLAVAISLIAVAVAAASSSPLAVLPVPRIHTKLSVVHFRGRRVVLVRSIEVYGVAGAQLTVSCGGCLRFASPIRVSSPVRGAKLYRGVQWLLEPGRAVSVKVFHRHEIGRFLDLRARLRSKPDLVFKATGCLASFRRVVACPHGVTTPRPGTPVPKAPATTPSPSPTRPTSYPLQVTVTGAGSGTVSGSGIACPGTCTASYPPGTAVSLTAAPAAGSLFGGWTGACSGSGSCAVTMNASHSIGATFVPDPNRGSRLTAGQQLQNGWYIASPTFHDAKLIMQSDGNLVLYSSRFDPARALWSSNTGGNAGAYAVMQSDGNFVVYSSAGKALWQSGTSGNSGAYVSLQDDGNLVVYSSSGGALWNAGTENLLSNPSFEQLPGAPGWFRNYNASSENDAAYGDASRAHDGVGFLEANTSATSGSSIAQNVAVTPQAGVGYTASIWLRSPDGTPFSICLALWFIGSTSNAASNCTTIGGSWQDVQVSGGVGGGYSSMRIEIYLKTTTHNLDFDTATLVG
jgi:hypothetical protein